MYMPFKKYLHLEIAFLIFMAYGIPLVTAKIFAADVKGVDRVLESVDIVQIVFFYLVSFFSFAIPAFFFYKMPSVADAKLLCSFRSTPSY